MNDNGKSDQVIKDIHIEARVPLDGHTLELRNTALAEASSALRKMKAEEKDRAKRARKVIAEKDAVVERLEETVNTATELGMVEGFERWDYDRWEVDTVRRDTGEVVNVRPMTQEERTAYKEPALDLDLGDPLPPGEGSQKVVHRQEQGPQGLEGGELMGTI